MFIGIISFMKDPVETVKIEAGHVEEASAILAEYVYNNYNKSLPMGGHYYVGVIIDPAGLRTISTSSAPYVEPMAIYC